MGANGTSWTQPWIHNPFSDYKLPATQGHQMILSVDSNTPMTRDSILKDYSQLFTGLGELEDEVTIYLKEGAVPIVHPARCVPHTIRNKPKEGIGQDGRNSSHGKGHHSNRLGNSLVVVEKANSKLRICLDPKDLNAAIMRPHYPMPGLDDALSKLAGAHFFSKLDAKSSYWQLKLTEQSLYLTTFNTPFGRYQFCRLSLWSYQCPV